MGIKKSVLQRRRELFEEGKGYCSKCDEEKELENFYTDVRTKYGFKTVCKECTYLPKAKRRNDGKKRYVYDHCSRCGETFDGEKVVRCAHPHYCLNCRRAYDKERRERIANLKEQRGTKEENDRRVAYFVNKIKLNAEKFSMYDISELITTYEWTFLTDYVGGKTMADKCIYMWNKLVEYNATLDIKKEVIRIK